MWDKRTSRDAEDQATARTAPRQSLRVIRPFVDALLDRSVVMLAVTLCLGVGGAAVYMSHLQGRLVDAMALSSAEHVSHALEQFRTLYTSEVVRAAEAHGIPVTHDYKTVPGAIPLPATLSMLLGSRLGDHGGGIHTSLYSPYPFPWRESTGGLRDDFAREAWQHLTHTTDQRFYRFETREAQQILRYARADRMRAGCVDCHNQHPDTPKRGWKVGDLRGVLEVSYPMSQARSQVQAVTAQSLALIAPVALLSLLILGSAIARTRSANVHLEQAVAARTGQLSESERRFRRLSEVAPIGILHTDEAGRIVFLNREAAQGPVERLDDAGSVLFDDGDEGGSIEGFLGEHWTRVADPEARDRVRSAW